MAKRDRSVSFTVNAKDNYTASLNKLKKSLEDMSAAQRAAFARNRQSDLEATRKQLEALYQQTRNLTEAENADRMALGQAIIQRGKLSETYARLKDQMLAVTGASRAARGAQELNFASWVKQTEAAQSAAAAAERAAAQEARIAAVRERASKTTTAGLDGWFKYIESLDRATLAEARSVESSERLSAAKLRANTATKSGFADWDRYASALQRVAAEQEKTAAADRMAVAIERSNRATISGLDGWFRYNAALAQGASASERAAFTAERLSAAKARTDAQVKSGFAAWDKQISQTNAATAALQKNTQAIAANQTEQRKLPASYYQPAPAQQNRRGAANQSSRGDAQEVSVFGLRPYHLQNLGYQVNDVISGLASGQKPMQVFAQQAGQIIQIWPKTMTVLAAGLTRLAGVGVVLAPVIAALMRAQTLSESIKFFDQKTELSLDGAAYDPEKLSASAEAMSKYGMTIKAAREEVLAFVNAGVDQKNIDSFVATAGRLAKVLGIDVADASKMVREAFTGTVDDVLKLDASLNFLTTAQMEQILQMRAQHDETAALDLAYQALQDRLDTVAVKADGPWSQAWKNLGSAWDSLVERLANSAPIRAIISLFDEMGQKLAWLLGLLAQAAAISPGQTTAGKNGGLGYGTDGLITDADIQGELKSLQELRRELEATQAALESSGQKGSGQWEALGEQIKEVEGEIAQVQKRAKDGIAALMPPPATPDSYTPKDDQSEANVAAEKKALIVQQEALEAQKKAAYFASLSKEEKYVAEAADRAIMAAQAQGVKLSDAQVAAIQEQARATYRVLDAEKERNKTKKAGATTDKVGADLMQRANSLLALRVVLQKQLTDAQKLGLSNEEQADIKKRLGSTDSDLNKVLEEAEAHFKKLGTTDAQTALTNIDRIREKMKGVTDDTQKNLLPTVGQLNDQMAQIGTDAISSWAQAFANGQNAGQAFLDTLRQGIANLLIQLGQAIIQMTLLKMIASTTIGANILGFLGGIMHSGGIVGRTGQGDGSRMVSPAVFAGAARYHTGGVVGLKSGEVPIIAMKEEEVITRDDPRHVLNGGTQQQQGSGSPNVKIVNTFDSGSFISEGLSTTVGQKAILNYIKANPNAVTQALNG